MLRLLLFLLFAAPAGAASEGALVEVKSLAPTVTVDIRYATSDNFTGRAVYPCGRCFLRKETAEKVARAQARLAGQGLSLKMWDCYRPLAVQRIFWSLVPDTRYVADPKKGSSHNRGSAVDVTLVDGSGREIGMPTGFDDFSPRASLKATGLAPKVLKNRELLTETMRAAGFLPLETEWWHFDDPQAGREILDVPFSELCR